jgi:SMODS-associating 2TM, beta-strand rich effector domain
LWKVRAFAVLGLSVPDLNGRWIGTLRSSYIENGQNKEIPIILEIRQRFSKVSVDSYTATSDATSHSSTATVQEIGEDFVLIFHYENIPNTMKAGTMQQHQGTARLKLIEGERVLHGRYFNDLGNYGDISVQFKSATLKHRY